MAGMLHGQFGETMTMVHAAEAPTDAEWDAMLAHFRAKRAGRGDVDGNQGLATGAVRYTWSHDGKPHEGSILLRDGGADYKDTFHASEGMRFEPWPVSGALLGLIGSYAMGGGPAWGWRIVLGQRPSGELVLQMTNVTPWGEDGRAVRMTFSR
jgi:hypothetical protein